VRSEVRRTRARGGRGGGVPDGVLDVDAEGCRSEFFMTYEEADVMAVSKRLVVPDIA
jgi:hypothetical protein